jgi:hypothetical protein
MSRLRSKNYGDENRLSPWIDQCLAILGGNLSGQLSDRSRSVIQFLGDAFAVIHDDATEMRSAIA